MTDTILIVDDDPAIREIFTLYLESVGYKILTAPGGMECLEMLKTQKPDLVLLDLMMEPMDGWETLLAIRHNPSPCYVPVIIITGKQPVPEEILQYGVLIEDFIVKPVDFKRIAESLHCIIEKDRDLGREIDRVKTGEQDPELLGEYTRLLRLVGVVHNLKKRLKNPLWADRIPLKQQEERLQWLHKKLGLPDRLLEWDEEG
jgi:two-component system OmpR family response regulator